MKENASAQEQYTKAQQQRRVKRVKLTPASITTDGAVTLDDFHAYMPRHNYIFAPSREPWPGSSVNARIPPIPLIRNDKPVMNDEGKQVMQAASAWLDQNKPVEQMTWAPGLPMIIPDRLVSEGGWIERRGVNCFNLYRPPQITPGDASKAGKWLDHFNLIYSEDADHMISWLAHRVQRPQEKINHSLVFGGVPGIGKDTLLEPVKYAVGPWNFKEVSPASLFGRFNGFAKSVILRISEARDHGEVDRFAFYEHTKIYTAAPPDVLRVDEKNLREHSVFNCTAVCFTTNHKTDGLYLPADDRRHYVAWSDAQMEAFSVDYWDDFWKWYESGGYGHVAAYLARLDLSGFNPKAPPPKTAAFWAIVDANRAPEDAELADALDLCGNPLAVTLADVQEKAKGDFWVWLKDRRNRRQLPHRFEKCSYVPVRNEAAKDGLWVVTTVRKDDVGDIVETARQVIYAKANISLSEQLRVASARANLGKSKRGSNR
jgi:hypothetical protein